jgi:hypothetical protein
MAAICHFNSGKSLQVTGQGVVAALQLAVGGFGGGETGEESIQRPCPESGSRLWLRPLPQTRRVPTGFEHRTAGRCDAVLDAFDNLMRLRISANSPIGGAFSKSVAGCVARRAAGRSESVWKASMRRLRYGSGVPPAILDCLNVGETRTAAAGFSLLLANPATDEVVTGTSGSTEATSHVGSSSQWHQ